MSCVRPKCWSGRDPLRSIAVKVITDPERARRERASVSADEAAVDHGHALTIGVFDGVHIGHRTVIGQVKSLAADLGAGSALVTFEPHPAQVLRPDLAPDLLTGLDHKLELLAETGLDTVVVVPFDRARAGESAEEFISSVLVGCLGAKAVVVGEDFHFGKGRLGNVALLRQVGSHAGFDVYGHGLVPRPAGTDELTGHGDIDFDDLGPAVSSTAIRRALAVGEVDLAAGLLGRPHEMRGVVVAGDQRGRTIGVPTANVLVEPGFAMPADGVYAGWYVRPDGDRRPAAINVGRRPTFYEHAEHSLIEAHLIDFDGDLYDQPARVRFVRRLRGERRFSGIEALSAQLHRDIDTARSILQAG